MGLMGEGIRNREKNDRDSDRKDITLFVTPLRDSVGKGDIKVVQE